MLILVIKTIACVISYNIIIQSIDITYMIALESIETATYWYFRMLKNEAADDF